MSGICYLISPFTNIARARRAATLPILNHFPALNLVGSEINSIFVVDLQNKV